MGLTRLTKLRAVGRSDLVDARALVHFRGLREVDLSGSQVTNTSFAGELGQLTSLRLDRCRQLADISNLVKIPTLTHVTLLEVLAVNPEDVRRLKTRCPNPVQVDFDPYRDPLDPGKAAEN